MAFYSRKVVSNEFVGPMTGTASFAVSASTAFSSSTSVMATNANNFRVSGSLIVTGSSTFTGTASFANLGPLNQNAVAISGSLSVTGSSTFIGTASFTNLGPIFQPVFRVTNAIQIGNSKRPSVNDALVFGNDTEVSGGYGVAVGAFTHVAGTGNASFVGGQYNSASAFFQHVVGQYNQTSSIPAAFIVGGGSSITDRRNVAVFSTASIVLSGSVLISGSLLVNGSPAGSGGGATVTISGSRPSGSVASGSLWWNTDDGNLYVQTTAPTGSVYVPATSNVVSAVTSSFALTASLARTASFATSASFATTASFASFAPATYGQNTYSGAITVTASPTFIVAAGSIGPGVWKVTYFIRYALGANNAVLKAYLRTENGLAQDQGILAGSQLLAGAFSGIAGTSCMSTYITVPVNDVRFLQMYAVSDNVNSTVLGNNDGHTKIIFEKVG